MSSKYLPPGETPAVLWQERSNLDGIFIMAVAYGCLFTVFLYCSSLFLVDHKHLNRKEWMLFGYTCLIFILATLFVGFQLKFTQMTFIDDRNYPGGPAAFNIAYYSYWVSMAANACFVVLNWFADGLLLYRYIMIWSFSYPMLIFPGMMYTGSIATSVCLLMATGRPGGGFWTKEAVKFGIAYWTLSISLNIILTFLIVGRLIARRKKMRFALGNDHGEMYTSISAMLIESATLYSLWGLAFLITYANNSDFNNLLLPALGQIQGISTLLIITRVAQGRGWSRRTTHSVAARLQAFRFGTGTAVEDMPSGSQSTAAGHGERHSLDGKVIMQPEDLHLATYAMKGVFTGSGYCAHCTHCVEHRRTTLYRNT